jgi:hypothetical protein
MIRRMHPWPWLAIGTALLFASCRCSDRTQSSFGEINVIFEEDGVRVSAPDHGAWDFGAVSMGKVATRSVTLQNTGRGVLTITGFEAIQTSTTTPLGAPVTAGPLVEADPVFSLAFDGPTDIAAGESHDFVLSFAPPFDPSLKQVDQLSVIRLKASSTDPAKSTAELTFKGKGVSGECELPSVIDFGAVAVGDSLTRAVVFTNARPLDTTAFVGALQSPQGQGIFSLTPDSPSGLFTVFAERSKAVSFTFTPPDAHDSFGTVTLRAADGCPEKPVRLIGTGVAQVVTCTPAQVEFGYVRPGLTSTGEVVCSNLALAPVTLTDLAAVEGAAVSSVFVVTEAQTTPTADLTRLVLPAATRDANQALVAGVGKVKLRFAPSVLGVKTGSLQATTDLRALPSLTVPLRGVGGGPNIELRPSSPFNFGRIAFFPSASVPSFATRTLTVRNVGTLPNPPDVTSNLRLGIDGLGGAGKYWKVVAKNANSSEAEVCLGVFDAATETCAQDLPNVGPNRYDPNVGLLASATSGVLDISVRISPLTLGQKEWDVTVFSNDPKQPTSVVTILANAVDVPPCTLSVAPLNLGFGVVSPPQTKDLGFSITNTSAQPCLLTNLQLQPEDGTPPGMPPVFVLPAGELGEKVLQPLESLQVLTRAWPQGRLPPTPATVVGHVQFNSANPNAPQTTVTLTATVAPSCLTIAPSDVDFGTVAKGCLAPERAFFIYNACTQPVMITGSGLANAAGQKAGGPNCPGTTPCPEFAVTSGVANGTVITSGAASPPGVRLQYSPIDLGQDTGSFVLHAAQGGQNVDYVVTLRGTGDTLGLNTDTFRQDLRPKADILLVIDDSGSMVNKQIALGNNLSAFLQYARDSQVDFHLAVTNTELTDPTLGDFRTSPGGYKVLTPATENLATEFSQLVRVGLTGGTESCFEGATRALTAPRITQGNVGFLRRDAVLAVVCVSDAGDQGPLPVANYLNQLLNVKGATRAGQFTFNAIGPLTRPNSPNPAVCDYDPDHDPQRYIDMVASTNGVKEEICTTDWATALENIGKSAFGFRTNFALTAIPASTRPLEVGIDAQPCSATQLCPVGQTCSTLSQRCVVPAVDARGVTVWSYDSGSNEVSFAPLYVPEPGKTLTVTYQVACNR